MKIEHKEQLLRLELRKREIKAGRRESRPGSLSLVALRREADRLLGERYPSRHFAAVRSGV